jgi:hypothetical protein
MPHVPRRSRSRGIGLVEILVAVAVFALVGTIVLTQLQAARRNLELGCRRIELQQSTRLGFGRIVEEVRLAGLAVRPDGDPLRPDEPFEAAYATALTVRGDLDGRGPEADDPEIALAGSGPFGCVTTGNDEIVTYVLAKSDGSSAESLTFEADVVGVPRDGQIETVRVDRIALDHVDPPYTLYRVRVRPDSTRTIREPVADQIARMHLSYFDGSGMEIPAPGGADDADSILSRASIRRIRIELVGISRTRSQHWIDPSDPDPKTRNHKKLHLETEITPRNADPFRR